MHSLPLHFHQTFIPERHYLASLMKYAQTREAGHLAEISEETGIPTGARSGKVEPTIYYAQGMGLLEATKNRKSGWQLALAPLGEVVSREDPFINEELSQWLLHLLLCRPQGGAEAWHTLFAEGQLALGNEFNSERLKRFFAEHYGNRTGVPGPIVRMYNDKASFAKAAVLSDYSDKIVRRVVPLQESFYTGYAATLLLEWDISFPYIQQVTLKDLEWHTRFFAVTGWKDREMHQFLDWLSDHNIVKMNRQTGTPVLLRIANTQAVLETIYNDLA